MTKTIEMTRWDVQDYLRTPEDCTLYIRAAIEEAADDPAFIAKVLDDVAQARGMTSVAPELHPFPPEKRS